MDETVTAEVPETGKHSYFVRDCWRAFGERIWDEPELASDLYRAMTSTVWVNVDGTRFAASWRAAGEIVAGLRMEGSDYLDYYLVVDRPGDVSDEIRIALAAYGWKVVE